MDVLRGFRRLGWVVIALTIPITAYVSYDSSSHMVGYEPRLLDTVYPELDSTSQRPVQVQGMGVVWVPLTLNDNDIDKYVKRYFTRATNPEAFVVPKGRYSIAEFATAVRKKYPTEYVGKDDVFTTKAVVTKYPVYRKDVAFREYELVPLYEKRPGHAALITAGVIALIALLVQGGLSVIAWVVRGFRSAA